MSSTETDVSDFLTRIVWSITLVLVYMMIILTAGIYGNWFFFYETPTVGNYVFYAWILLSTAGTLYLLIKWWKKKFPHG
ncbi:MAG: hypothetical protein ABIU63_15350 [Chitinophagaceae bacterium]